jgi:hypothetical protein
VAKLVEFLAAGANGAASGTATFVLRGTASSALSVMFTDFEMTAQPSSNVIDLDSNGAAEIYVNAYCDVTIKNSAGSTLRTVTTGESATTVEVISDSFTGTDYSGSPTAVSEPITLAAVLDKWNNSAGSIDWKVDVSGVSTNISSAIAGFSGIFTNVKDPTFGAVGDGATDDTTAIGNAITAASGGIVFFPPGNYIVSVLTFSDANVTLLGSGPGAVTITGNSAGTRVINITDNTATGWKRIEGIKIAATAAYTNLIDLEETQNIYFQNCEFDGTNVTGAIINRPDVNGQCNVFIDNCKFTVVAANDQAINNLSDDAESFISVKNSFFTIGSGFTGSVISGPDFNINGCEFDASVITSGVYYHISPNSAQTPGKMLGLVVGNTFIDGGSEGFAFRFASVVTGCVFTESSNRFMGFPEPADMSDSGQIYSLSTSGTQININLDLKSRDNKTFQFANTGSSSLFLAPSLVYSHIIINHTNASNLTIFVGTSSAALSSAECFVLVLNNSGDARTITFATGFAETTVPDGGVAFCKYKFTQENTSGTDRAIVLSKGQVSS